MKLNSLRPTATVASGAAPPSVMSLEWLLFSAVYGPWMKGKFRLTVKLVMPVSHQDDVVLLLVVESFDLQRDRLADSIAQHGEALRFFVQE